MTEDEWARFNDLRETLESLRRRASSRKFRLYLCGGCRQLVHLFYSPESLAAVEVAERFVDGQADQQELQLAEGLAEVPKFGYDLEEWFWGAHPDEDRMGVVFPRLVELGALHESALHGGEWRVNEAVKWRLCAAADLAEACAARNPAECRWDWAMSRVEWPGRWLVDCVFGDASRSLHLSPSLRTPVVVALAQAAYEDRLPPQGHLAADRLAVLADALLDAGCDDEGLLGHLRGEGPHVRGCWAVDLVLGHGLRGRAVASGKRAVPPRAHEPLRGGGTVGRGSWLRAEEG